MHVFRPERTNMREALIELAHIGIDLRQGFDIGREEVVEDLGCTSGFLRAVQLCTRVRSGGLAWLGVPCSSFTFLASSYHQRTMDNPMGRVDRPGVRLGNLLLARSMLLILVCIARSVYFFIEQPRPWIHALHKPLGKGIRELIRQRKSFAKKEMVKVSMTKSKDGTTSGGKNLKESGAYPASFGERVAELHTDFMEPGIDWDCAELEPLLERIQQAVSCGEFRADPAIPVQIRPSKHIFEVAKEVYRRAEVELGIRC
ncbi:unnamed protein product [Effrenium voratum]|uniref:Uncharacterized protein n=1 Tax=Effrenium voratum TaxID=2562239 RepID=A0AA36INA4_9DINO|nr:unnamed protein product [Effrenium voratum]